MTRNNKEQFPTAKVTNSSNQSINRKKNARQKNFVKQKNYGFQSLAVTEP